MLNAALRGEATGSPRAFNGDVMATAKRDLAQGEILDGEGGTCVWGKLAPAAASLARECLTDRPRSRHRAQKSGCGRTDRHMGRRGHRPRSARCPGPAPDGRQFPTGMSELKP